MKAITSCLLVVAMLCGCGIEEGIKRNDDRYLKPGALDLPLTNVNDTYQYKFLDKYRITHQWPRISNCSYRKVPTLGVNDGFKGEFFAVLDIYESNGKTWQRFEGMKPFDFDRYVRSVKVMRPTYETVNGKSQRVGEAEMEEGFRPLCFQSWWVTSLFFSAQLHKRDLATWRAIWAEGSPKGKWSERRIGSNIWLVQETAEQDFRPRPLNGVGGPFQSWLLPIGDTGYTLALELGASKGSLQYPEAHARMQAAFRHLIESVGIEPLQP